MAMLRKLKRILSSIKKDFNLKMEDYGSMEILYNDSVGYLVHFYRQKRNLGPSHLKRLIEHVEKEIKRAFDQKEIKERKIILILGTKITEGAKDIIQRMIDDKNVYILEVPTGKKYTPNGKTDSFFETLASVVIKSKII